MFTNVGLTLLATALQTPGANAGISYVSLGVGCGVLSSALTNGSMYTSLSLTSPLTRPLANGQSLTIMNSLSATQIVTSLGALLGASSIPVSSFTASTTFAVGSGVVTTPATTDVGLFQELVRSAAFGGTAGGSPGESLNGAYFDPTTSTNLYLEVGYFGSSTATSILGTGILIARDVQFWNHTVGADSALFNLDSIL